MKRILSLLLAMAMLAALAACAGAGSDARIDEILETLQHIQETVDAIPPDAFLPEETVGDEHAVTFLAEDSDFRRQTKRGTLTVGMVAEPGSFDPCDSAFAAGIQLVYEPLFTLDEHGEIRGVLAEEWEFREDAQLYIRLHDAFFSNGDPVTTEDCLWSLQRAAGSGSRQSHLFDFLDFEKSKTLSDTELLLAFRDDFGPGLLYLTTYCACILDKDYVSAAGEEAFSDQPVGSGPYVYTAAEDGSEGVFELREDYWNTETTPEAGTIRILFYDDSSVMLDDFTAGTLDMAFYLDADGAERLLSGEIADTSYVIQSDRSVMTLVLPEYVEAFEDVRVRRAVAMAVNWDAVRESGLGILGAAADSILPRDLDGRMTFGSYEYDPDAAMILLEEAGYDYSQSYEFVVVNDDADIRMAKAIQHDLQAVGINVHVGVCGRSDAEERYRSGDTSFLLWAADTPALDPDQVFDPMADWSVVAGTRITEEPLPTYLEIGRWSVDGAIRAEAYRNAQSWMFESIRQIPIAEVYGCYCFRPYIASDLRFDGVGTPDLRLVRFAS